MISAAHYHPIYLYLTLVLTIVACCRAYPMSFKLINRPKGWSSIIAPFILCLILALFLGGRPITGYYFGDTGIYAHSFRVMINSAYAPSDEGEWIWNQFMYFCAHRMDVSQYLTIICLGYFGFTLWACQRFAPNNVWIMVLFNLAAFSFFTYGTNGIRNGLACAITLVAISYLVANKRSLLIACTLAFIAVNIHRSTSLPLLMAFISTFCIRSFKVAYTFWILSILISLVAGSAVTSLFAGLGFDDRVSYLQEEASSEMFSHTGFRWDFLLYSMMPIVLGYYIVMRRGIRNATYEFLLNTYTLSNAFWVMVIRANYSNRFAYLSWFMYPMVLAYPLLKMNVWDKRQGEALSLIMFMHAAFTWFMSTIY